MLAVDENKSDTKRARTGRGRVFVVGGGIVGISCALSAQRRGFDVTLADPRGFANGASYGNAGVIANSECVPLATPGVLRTVPWMLLSKDSPLTIRWRYLHRIAPWMLRFVRSSTPGQVRSAAQALASLLALSKAAHYDLAREAGTANAIREVGWLKAFESDAAFKGSARDFELMQQHGVACQYLNGREIREREPGLSRNFKHAILHTDCAQIDDPGAYCTELGQLFLSRGGQLVRSEVLRLESSGGRVQRAHTGTEAYEADQFVIAAGAWSRKLAADVGDRVPLDTERGYHLVFKTPNRRVFRQPIYWAEKSVVMSASEGRLRVTSSVEFAGLDAKPDFRKLQRQVADLRSVTAGECGAIEAEWLGFRPSMPDSLPVLGRSRRTENCVLAFGHGHLGLTAGPITGEIVGRLLANEPTPLDIRAFSSARFA
jgi:D-amino-acid dehydrogenase